MSTKHQIKQKHTYQYIIFFILLMWFVFACKTTRSYSESEDTVLIIANPRSIGTYVYDQNMNVCGYLLNGCPVDPKIIQPLMLDADAEAMESSKHIINVKNCTTAVSQEQMDEYQAVWGYGIAFRKEKEFFKDFPEYKETKPEFIIREKGHFSIVGEIGDYYYVLYNHQYGYVVKKGVAINPSFGLHGRKYTILPFYIHTFKECETTGNELIGKNEAIEIARGFVETNWLIVEQLGHPEARANCVIRRQLTDGYQTVWQIIAEVDNIEFYVYVNTDTGEIVEYHKESDMHG